MRCIESFAKLNRRKRREVRAAIAAARRPANVLSAQDSIPFERMFPDGICRVEGKFYSKTIQFQDINYQLSQN